MTPKNEPSEFVCIFCHFLNIFRNGSQLSFVMVATGSEEKVEAKVLAGKSTDMPRSSFFRAILAIIFFTSNSIQNIQVSDHSQHFLTIARWKESAKATCLARNEKILRASHVDLRYTTTKDTFSLLSALYRKSQVALKAQNSDSSAEDVEEFNFSVGAGCFLLNFFRIMIMTAQVAMIRIHLDVSCHMIPSVKKS